MAAPYGPFTSESRTYKAPLTTPPPGKIPLTQSARPLENSTTVRFDPHYPGEPIAGFIGTNPYYTDANTLKQRGGPKGDPSAQWNAAQVAKAKSIAAKNYGLPGYIVRSMIPGGLDQGGTTSVARAIERGANAASLALPGGGVGEAAGLLGGLRAARAIRAGEAAAEVAPHLTPEAGAVREALKGAKTVRAGQAAGFSQQRGSKFSRVESIYRDTSLTPEERQARARAVLSGQLQRPTYIGFKKLGPDEVTNLKAQIMEHDTLRTGQKTTLVRSLDRAVAGIVPTAGEQKLFEQTFGKAVMGGITQGAKSGRWKNIAVNILNTPRTLQATGDLSAFLRQGAVALARHPLITSKNFVPMLRAFGSEGYTQRIEHEIASHPNFPLMQTGKLALTGGDALSPHEEQFAAHMLEAIGGGKNPIRWSSRAYSTFLNKTRADVFNHLLGVAQAQGRNIHDEQFLRDLGEAVNIFTGRGGLPDSMQRAANVFNGLFFSPRLAMSRVKLVGQLANPALARRNPFVYKQYARANLQTFGGLLTILGLAKANGLNVGTDPRSADFGKIKFGNTRIDLGAGFLQYAHLLGQLATGQYKSSTTGKVSKLGGGFGQRSYYDVLGGFAGSKLSPPFSFGRDVLKQQTNFGPFNLGQEAYSHLTPLVWQDTYDIYKQHGGGEKRIPLAAAGALLSIFGGGTQTYGPKQSKSYGGSSSSNPFSSSGSGGGNPFSTSGSGSGNPFSP